MNLENSDYLWLLLILPVFLSFSLVSYQRANTWLYRFAHRKKRSLPFAVSTIFLSLALASVIISLARPAVQYTRVVFNRSGSDVVIGIDVSKSMLAEDETVPDDGKNLFALPNRLNRARYCALSIVNALKGERVAVFMFAGKGVSIIPLTTDYAYCRYVLKHFNDATITSPGSDLSQAIGTGVSLFEGGSGKTVKSIILISDGEDIGEDPSLMQEAAQRAAFQGIAVYTVGVGMGQGVLIPVRDSTGSTIMDYYQDEEGAYLRTRLEQDTLKGIAAVTGGSYVRARDEHSGESVVDAIVSRARSVEYAKVTEPAWFDLSPFLLGAAFLLLAAGILLGR